MSQKTIESFEMKHLIIAHRINATRDFGSSTTTYTWTVTDLYGKNLPGAYYVGIYGRCCKEFAGITGPVWVKIGDSSQAGCYMGDFNLMSDNDLERQGFFIQFPSAQDSDRAELMPCTRYLSNYRFGLRQAPIVTFTSSSGNLSSLTAGEIEIVFDLIVPK